MPTIPLTVQERLEEAQTAYHRLMTGTSAREVVDMNGERVTFTAVNKDALYNYIRTLEASLPTAPSPAARYGPATFTF